jgi:hypothetical protein
MLEERAMRKQFQILAIIIILILLTLACSLSGTATPDPSLFKTQVAVAMTQTALSNPPVVPTSNPIPTQDPGLLNTQVAVAMTQTALSNPPVVPTAEAPTQTSQPPTQTNEPPAPTAQDIHAMIDSSNILVYEDIADDPTYIPYVKEALKSVGGYHKYVADAMGTFMSEMNSGTKWDLIIVAAELRTLISGDYWTVLKQKVDDGSALVTEIWYLDDINDGKIAPFLRECGVELQSDWQAKLTYNRIDYGMYWIQPNSPVFNTPNKVNAFGAALSEADAAWTSGDLGDILEVTDSSKADILASLHAGEASRYGVLSECMGGRVLFQTFSSHNYPTNDMIALWENYINYTLTNHFKAH